jgi:hypothetical protein
MIVVQSKSPVVKSITSFTEHFHVTLSGESIKQLTLVHNLWECLSPDLGLETCYPDNVILSYSRNKMGWMLHTRDVA